MRYLAYALLIFFTVWAIRANAQDTRPSYQSLRQPALSVGAGIAAQRTEYAKLTQPAKYRKATGPTVECLVASTLTKHVGVRRLPATVQEGDTIGHRRTKAGVTYYVVFQIAK